MSFDMLKCLPSIGDTRIFSLSASLNSLRLTSVFPINLSVLDALHSFVYGLPHRKRRRAKHTHCESFICPLGSKCVHSTGQCECRSMCRGVMSPVCGDDHVTYASFCHLTVRSCLLNKKGKKLIVKYRGNCRTRNPCEELRCGPGEDCVVSQKDGILSAKCVCPESCPSYGDSVESSPVCASNGVDYSSRCAMKQHACSIQFNLTVKYFGKCDPCAEVDCPFGTTCRLTSNRKPECRCSEQCSLAVEPVCASDGKTYSNECVMKVAACKENRMLQVFKRGECKDDWNPCSSLECTHGARCEIGENKMAKCQCRQSCAQIMKPVCATNGMTFDNACELERYACNEKARITMKHEGACGTGACSTHTGCVAPQVCQMVHGHAECTCPNCEGELREVCGSDGRTYENECKMRRAACLLNKSLYVKYNGICEGCAKMNCEFYSICYSTSFGKAECRCPTDCPLNQRKLEKSATVCGTDGVTYSSECHLRRSACQQKKFIVVAFQGKCDACLHVECKYGEECRAGTCMCSYNCPSNPSSDMRVCGENGVLYPSDCHLQLASCQKGMPISAMPLVHCHSAVQSFPDSCKCNRVGSYGPTCDSKGQCSCRPGVGGAKCDHCLPTFWGIHLIADGALSCQPCGCSAFGSSRSDCEQTTGRCECLRGAFGDKCDTCANNMIMTANGCVPKEEYKTPGTCSSTKCHHGAVCIESHQSLPDCKCPASCSSNHLGIAANMTVCGSDGITYENRCDLLNFACKHQIDVVVRSLGICDDDIDHLTAQDRRERERWGQVKIGSPCTLPHDCAQINGICVTRAGRRGVCACAQDSTLTNGKCEKLGEARFDFFLSGKNGSQIEMGAVHLFMNITITISPQLSNGVILFAKGEKGDDFYLRIENRRIVAEIGADSLHSRDYLGLHVNHTCHFTWRGKMVTLRTEDSQLTSKIETTDQKVSQLWIGDNGNSDYASMAGHISQLIINDIPISTRQLKRENKMKVNFLYPAMRFNSSGFLEFPEVRMNVRAMTEISMEVRPESQDGLIFYWGSLKSGRSMGNFLALFIVGGQPHFFWNLGSGIAYVKSATVLKSEQWSSVVFGRNLRNGFISVNNETKTFEESKPSHSQLNVAGRSVYLGGVSDVKLLPKKLRKLNVSFVGSIQRITINEQVIDLRAGKSHGVVSEYKSSKCSNMCSQDTPCYERNNEIRCKDSNAQPIFLDGKNELAFMNKGNETLSRSNVSHFSFSFRTTQSEGVLWWESTWEKREDGDFLIIYVQKDKLKLALNLGNDRSFKPVTIKDELDRNEWNDIKVERINRSLSVFLNGKLAITVVSTPGSTQLDSNGLVYIGGRSTRKANIVVPSMFIGCIRNVTISQVKVDLIHDFFTQHTPQLCSE